MSTRGSVLLSAAAAGLLCISVPALAQPANDACASAQVLVLTDPFIRLVGDTTGATSDIASSGCSSGDNLDVWYTFTAPRAGLYGVTTLASTPNAIDTVLTAYSTCNPLSAATRIACNDDIDDGSFPVANNLSSYINFTLAAGQSVWIRVAGATSPGGTQGQFTLTVSPPPLNDTCAAAQAIALNATTTATNIAAGTSFQLASGSTACTQGFAGSRGLRDVFYRFTPAASGAYRISLCGSDYDTNLSVFASCPAGSDTGTTPVQVPTSSVIACSEDKLAVDCDIQSEIESVTLSAGVQYIIRVAGYDWSGFSTFGPLNGQGVFTLQVAPAAPTPPAPANDLCANAQAITAVPFDSGDVAIGGATDDADITCNAFAASVSRSGIWYTYTPASNCTLLLRPTGAAISSIAVFTGSCGSLNQVDCSGNGFVNENATFAAQAGTTYTILLARYEASPAGALDTTRLTVDCITPLANDTCQGAQTIAFNTPVNADNSNATNQNDGPGASCQGLAGKGIWFRFVAPTSDPVTITTCGSPIDTVLQIFSNVDCANPAQWATYACADAGCPDPNTNGNARLENLPVFAGETYYIRVSSGQGIRTTPPGGPFTLTVEGVAPTTVPCCRGTTCTLVAPADCTVPSSPVVGVSLPDSSTCNASGNNTSPCCFADFDKSGAPSLDDIFIYLNAWFANSPFTRVGGDGTGTPNLDDLFIFLNVWFAGCA